MNSDIVKVATPTELKIKIDVRPMIKITDEVQIFLDKTGKANIKTKADFENAGELRNSIRKHLADVEKIRKVLVKPLDDTKKIVQAAAKKVTDPLELALKALNDGMLAYQTAEEKRIAVINERRVEKAAEKGLPATEIKLKEPTKVAGFTTMKKWKARVVDFAKLPDIYKIPDESKLNEIATATAGEIEIPGVEFFEDVIPTGRIQ